MPSYPDLEALEQELMINHNGKRDGVRVVFFCPECSHNKAKASYHTQKHVWHCWVCSAKGHAVELARLLGIQVSNPHANVWKETERQAYAKERKAQQKAAEAKEETEKEAQKKRFNQADADYKVSTEGLVSQYCEHKDIPTFRGVHCIGSETLLPIINIDSKVIAYQKIYRERTHEVRFAKITCGPSKGGLFFIDNQELKTELPTELLGNVLFCEGFSTGASLHLATDYPVICTISARAMEPRIKEILEKYQSSFEGIVCADNDCSKEPNIGLQVGKTVAYKFRMKICFPQARKQESTDFNDLHQFHSLEAVRKTIMNAKRIYSNPNRLKPSDKGYKTYRQRRYARLRGWI